MKRERTFFLIIAGRFCSEHLTGTFPNKKSDFEKKGILESSDCSQSNVLTKNWPFQNVSSLIQTRTLLIITLEDDDLSHSLSVTKFLHFFAHELG